MCDLANTETHSWSKDKDYVTVACSVTTGTGMSLCISKVQRSLWRRKRKIVRIRNLGKKTGSSGQNKTVASTSKTWTTSHQSKC